MTQSTPEALQEMNKIADKNKFMLDCLRTRRYI